MENTGEKVKGLAKESLGKVTGDEDKIKEGEAQQKKAQKTDEAERLAAEAEQKEAEAAGYKGEQMKHQD